MQPRVLGDPKQPPQRAVPKLGPKPPRVQQRSRERLRRQISGQLRITSPPSQKRDNDPLMPTINLPKRSRLARRPAQQLRIARAREIRLQPHVLQYTGHPA